MNQSTDNARLTLMFNDLRLPAIKQDWPSLAEKADKESWPAARFLAMLAEHEIAKRDRRRLARHLAKAQLLPGKTLDSFDFEAVPMISKAHVLALCAGNAWIGQGANLLLIGAFIERLTAGRKSTLHPARLPLSHGTLHIANVSIAVIRLLGRMSVQCAST